MLRSLVKKLKFWFFFLLGSEVRAKPLNSRRFVRKVNSRSVHGPFDLGGKIRASQVRSEIDAARKLMSIAGISLR